MEPITKEEAEQVIIDFYKLMDQKPKRGYLTDFFKLLDENVIWRFKHFHFDGHRGFEDHQEGKRKLFDETHEMQEMDTRIEGDVAITEAKSIWSAKTREEPATVSTYTKARHTVTWKVKRSEITGKAIIISHICTNIEILEGEIPPYLRDE